MKKAFLAIAIVFLFAFTVRPAASQEKATDSSEVIEKEKSEEDAIKEKINDLKERLATRVAELQAKNRRSYYGIIKKKEEGSITLSENGDEAVIVTNEETSYESQRRAGKRTDVSFDDLELGQAAVVFGTLDLDQKTIVAESVVLQTLPKKASGVVKEIDVNEGSFSINGNGGLVVLDYEISTRCTMYGENKELTRCGLSKIQEGDWVYVRMDPEENDLTKATALRILLIPSLVLSTNGVEAPSPPSRTVSPFTLSATPVPAAAE